MGARYHDQFTAVAGQGIMSEVGARDEERIARIAASDAAGVWELVRENQDDDLKWCGSAPFYAFLKAAPKAQGELLRYEQLEHRRAQRSELRGDGVYEVGWRLPLAAQTNGRRRR